MKLLSAILALLSIACFSSAADLCTVTDEKTGYQYDVTALKKPGSEWQVKTPTYTYFFNMCGLNVRGTSVDVGGVSKSCSTDSKACQIDTKNAPEDPKSLGNTTTISIVDNGELKYVISGGDVCRGGIQRKAVFLLHCNKNAGIGAPVFTDESEKCTYLFEWETAAACPVNGGTVAPPTTKTCHVIDSAKNVRYDLTPLSLSQGNWVVNHEKYEFLLNVCDEVHGITKCKGHGGCQTMPEDETFAKTLGLSTAVPTLEDGVLKLKLEGGQLCHETYSRQTVIIFSCAEGEGLGKPRYVDETDECTYYFSWESSAACGEPLTEVCTAHDSATGKDVDIGHLAKQQGQSNWQAKSAVENDVATYKLNVCNTLIPGDHNCRDGTSICQSLPEQTTGRSLGNYGTLSVNNEEVVLKYVDGDMCPNSNQRVTTEIYLICDPNIVDGVPRLISSIHDCEYLFTWKSAEVCEKASTGGKNVGGIIFGVLFALLAGLFVVGILYNRYIRREKGLYQIPCYDFCQACYYTGREKITGVGAGAVQL